LSSFLTILSSNDIVILTLTPIICYFAKYIKTDPIPFLFPEFFAANVWSMLFYIGNPTNLIVAQAYDMGFFDYLVISWLPTLVSGMSLFFILLAVYWQRIPAFVLPPNINPWLVMRSAPEAAFGSIVMLLTIVGLIVARWPLWAVTLPFGIIMLVKDLLVDSLAAYRNEDVRMRTFSVIIQTQLAIQEAEDQQKLLSPGRPVSQMQAEAPAFGTVPPAYGTAVVSGATLPETFPKAEYDSDEEKGTPSASAPADQNKEEMPKESSWWSSFTDKFDFLHLTSTALSRCPWAVGPFVIGMFILVEGLEHQGWIDIFAKGLGAGSQTLAAAIF